MKKKPRKILIVDDSENARNDLALVAKGLDIEYEEATDGEEGLKKLLEKGKFSLVFLDIHMPLMSGAQFLEHFYAKPEYDRVPIVVCTTEASPEIINAAKEKGIMGWIVKPFKRDKITNFLREYFTDEKE